MICKPAPFFSVSFGGVGFVNYFVHLFLFLFLPLFLQICFKEKRSSFYILQEKVDGIVVNHEGIHSTRAVTLYFPFFFWFFFFFLQVSARDMGLE